ncbi:MAG: TonB-dependent receptor, partial [Phycisphaeraceae bacterium]|nr:TonB-dependent receptor [Phycisphaeraceae bacterium]
QNQVDLTDNLHLTLGGRFNYARIDADQVQDPNTNNQISIDEEFSSVVGSARATWEILPDELTLFGGVSQGFRAPNVGDLTRFDTARSNEFETPAPGLDEEEYLTFEIGTKAQVGTFSAQAAYFYTDIDDQIIRFPTGDVVSGNNEVTKSNVGDGQVFGAELTAAWAFDPSWTLFGNAAYVEGEVTTFPTSAQVKEEEYLSRLMPLTGQIGLRWDPPRSRFWAEGIVRMATEADKLSTRDQNDTQRIPPGGTPGYAVLSLRGGWQVNEHLSLVAALENVTDENYRIHGSGQNEPGINAILTLRGTF